MINKDLLNLLGEDKKKLGIVTAFNIIKLLINVSITAVICYTLYLPNTTQFFNCLILVTILSILKYIITVNIGKVRHNLGNKIKQNLRNDITNKMFDLGIPGSSCPTGINENTAGTGTSCQITQLTIEGVEQLNLYYTYFLPNMFYGMVAPVILFIISCTIEWRTALVLILCLPLIPVSIITVSKFAKKIFKKYWQKYISMGDGFLDSLLGMKELKIFNADQLKQKEIAEKSEEFRTITMKVLVMQLFSLTFIDLVAYGGAGVAIVVTLLQANKGGIELFKALFLILISVEFFLPMRALGSAFHVAMNGSSAGEKLLTFLDLEPANWGDKNVNTIRSISLKELKFSYIEDKIILNNITATFNKGLNGIVGKSGSGKSTITSLLIGSNAPQKGVILLNDSNLQEYSRRSFYDNIAIVNSNTHIFNKSIRDNFLLNNSNITDDEILHALEQVNLLEFAEKNGGLDYVILEDSENISGGQKQRLGYAINTIRPKQIFIFDEPTSNIDVESEEIIMSNITNLAKNSIVILISHRLQNVINADNIIVLQEGEIVETGTHKELISKAEVYNNMYQTQYDLENSYKERKNA